LERLVLEELGQHLPMPQMAVILLLRSAQPQLLAGVVLEKLEQAVLRHKQEPTEAQQLQAILTLAVVVAGPAWDQ
jgi:hypothetical protein